ncbi:MAG: PilZ domain-containing protein [Candidatus Omnitrophica bacterium]|nr:PilZ domain-containing protein [Candidatus Omnitrophota bacterium]
MDKRHFPRANYPCKVVVLRTDLKETFSTHTENIGTGGICVMLPKELPKLCAVEILLYLKDGGSPLECNGRIVWMIKSDGTFDAGIEFIDINDVDRWRVEALVKEHMESNGWK